MHPVRELIIRRALQKSLPGKRTDGFKLGLAIEGGGMRGVISGGMVTGLHHLELQNVFDVVYGSSAGAINGAFFLSGQTPFGTTIYYEEINNSQFVDIRRWFSKTPVMSLEFLLDHVMTHERVLDWHALLSQPVPLRILATSVSKLRAEVLGDFESRDELWEAMRASARIPVIAGPPVPFRDDVYLDATLYESIPYRSAIAEGCTHVLVLRTRAEGVRLHKTSLFSKYIVAGQLSQLNPGLRSAVFDRPTWYDADCDLLESATNSPQIEGSQLMCVYPPPTLRPVGRMETDRETLVSGASEGAAAAVQALTGVLPDAVEVIQPFVKGWPLTDPWVGENVE